MSTRLTTLAAALLLAAIVSPADPAAAVDVSPAHGFAPASVVVKFRGGHHARAMRLPRGVSVRGAVAALRQSAHVAYAAPDFIATASSFLPDDTGRLRAALGVAGGWTSRQWNFLPWQPQPGGGPFSPGGIDAVGAWRNLNAAGDPGAAGVTVAVLDTGIAYRGPMKGAARVDRRFRRSPDFRRSQFAPGWNFVAGNALPVDVNGHGTHVAGTIAEATNNRIGLTGLAYRAKLMPVQVLNSRGHGRASKIAAGIRYAVENGADVINMSFNFSCGKPVPEVAEAIRQAHRAGVVVVASVGNFGTESCVSAPATLPWVIGVGGTTEGGCLGEYSLPGPGVDLLAPGGGAPAPGCRSLLSRPIFQVTLRSHGDERFGLPANYIGTSMAAAHVSGVAAMVLAAGVIRRRPKASVPAQVLRRLQSTARDLGLPRIEQGAGLIDAAAATAPSPAPARRR